MSLGCAFTLALGPVSIKGSRSREFCPLGGDGGPLERELALERAKCHLAPRAFQGPGTRPGGQAGIGPGDHRQQHGGEGGGDGLGP